MTRSASGICRLLEAQKAEWGFLDCGLKVCAPLHAVAVVLAGVTGVAGCSLCSIYTDAVCKFGQTCQVGGASCTISCSKGTAQGLECRVSVFYHTAEFDEFGSFITTNNVLKTALTIGPLHWCILVLWAHWLMLFIS